MKRTDAIHKLRTVCQRLDEADPATFFVVPLRLYLLGSLLTDKPNPGDVDLLFEYRERPDLDVDEALGRFWRGEPLPMEQAVRHLRRGMKWIRIEYLVGNSLEEWLAIHLFAPDTPVRLVWEPGLDWPAVVDEIEAQPAPWDPTAEEHRKEFQQTAQRILREQGLKAAMAWAAEQRSATEPAP
ncbi:MAG: hypothetical protein KKB13_01170 [Chloroflexi bacterium]|nr:hypothetical protein [Chloroflexota bacterium]